MKTLLILSAIAAITLVSCTVSQPATDEYSTDDYRSTSLYSTYDPFYNPFNDPYAYGGTRYYYNGRYYTRPFYTRPAYTRPAYTRPVYVRPATPSTGQYDYRKRRPARTHEYRNTSPSTPRGHWQRRGQ